MLFVSFVVAPSERRIAPLYDGHLVRRGTFESATTGDRHRTVFRLEARQPQRRRTRCPSYKERAISIRPLDSEPPVRTSNRPFVRRTSCPSRNSRIRRHRRATHNGRSSSKPAGPSVDGQEVRRTRKEAISSRPLDSEPPVRTSNRLFVRRTSCPSRNFRIRHHRRSTLNGIPARSQPAPASTDKMSVVQGKGQSRSCH